MNLTLQQLRTEVAAILGEDPADIAEDEDLIELGLDSIRLMTLAERWHRAGLETSFAELAERPTIEQWWALLSPPAPHP
ncbi:aryl carrier-like protein [Kitasatospora sp. MAA4]|uniref:phosphopantetheine-binding protein n=1 Tax=Kitasatospora sp. MAA4 TaxID=3035093 RepID=UPI002476E685|nr:phosphopantetheine-binding protein [Kitasatospora sp. MAA4]MDH6130784.1 aryl carrier-like protein [Kitasatospora sp. MAA4]